MTPAPGTQFADPVGSVPPGMVSFFEQAARRNVTWLSSMHCIKTGHGHVFIPGPESDGSGLQNGVNQGISGNWSGYELGRTARYVQAGWTIPTVSKPPIGAYSPAPSKYYSSAWSGIGGSSSAQLPLIQSGTEHDVSSSGVASYNFWYEIYGGSADTGGEIVITDTSIAPVPGNVVGNVALWDATSLQTQLGVCNFSDANKCLTFVFLRSTAPGNSSEWIGEAPSVGVTPLPLADFGAISFINACWAQTFVLGGNNNTCSTIGSSPTLVQLSQYTYGSNQIVASPGPITQNTTSSNFADSYLPPVRGN